MVHELDTVYVWEAEQVWLKVEDSAMVNGLRGFKYGRVRWELIRGE